MQCADDMLYGRLCQGMSGSAIAIPDPNVLMTKGYREMLYTKPDAGGEDSSSIQRID